MTDEPRRAAALAALRAAVGAAGLAPQRDPGSAGDDAVDPPPHRVSGLPADLPPPSPPPPPDPAGQDGEPDPHAVAHTIVMRQLAMAPRSRAQLERKLAQRGCDPAVAAAVLDRLASAGLVDDAAFAQTLVQSRRRTKGLAGAALLAELREKGVDPELSRAAVGGLDEQAERAERARAEELVARRLRTMAGLEPQVQARRLAAMLTRKGYGPGVAYAVVREAINSAPEHQRD